MIVIEYMENGSLDAFLRVSITFDAQTAQSSIFCNFSLHLLESVPDSRQSAVGPVHRINIINLCGSCCSAVTYISLMVSEDG